MSCLFDSLAPAIGISSDLLRKNIASYLKTDPKLLDDICTKEIVAWTENKNLDEYVDRMMKSDTWGGAIEIKAFCELFRIDVTIHVQYTGKQFTIKASKPASKNIHIRYTGTHFTSMYTIIF